MLAVRSQRAFLFVCAATFGTYMAQGLLYPALPLYLTTELGTTKAMAGLVVSSLSIAGLSGRVWAGPVIDRRGRKPVILAGTALVAASGVGLALVGSVAGVLAMRLLQGLGGALGYSAAAAMVADLAPPEQRTRYLARFGVFFYVGFALGPWLAEALIGSFGFTSVWWAVVAFAGAGAVVASTLPETGGSAGTAAAGTAGTAAAAAARVGIRRRMFHPAAVPAGIVFLCVGVGWTAISSFLALYAREIGLGSSDGLFIVLSITVVAIRPFAGNLAERFGKIAVLVPSVALCTIAMTVLAAVRAPLPTYVALAMYGAGFSALFPVLFSIVVDRAPDRERATAMSSFNVFFDIGAPIGGYGVGALVDVGGFGLGFGVMAVFAAAGGLALLNVARSESEDDAPLDFPRRPPRQPRNPRRRQQAA